MPTYTLRLDGFEFPPELESSRANFRVVFDVKYWARRTRDTYEPKVATSVKPGADVFWECDPGRSSRPNFVRAMDGDEPLPRIDIERLDDWDRQLIHVTAEEIIAVRAKVYDVDREDFFDRIQEFIGGLLEGVFGAGAKVVSEILPDGARDSAGDALDEIHSYIVKKVTGGGDKVLFQGSAAPDSEGRIVIRGSGTDGKKASGPYEIRIQREIWSGPTSD